MACSQTSGTLIENMILKIRYKPCCSMLKSFRRFFLVPSLLFVSACQIIVDSSIQLSDDFVAGADEYLLKTPTWRFSDKFYEAELGNYRATQVNTSQLQKEKETKISSEIEDYSLYNLLFRGRLRVEGYLVDKFEIARTQDFSYHIEDSQATTKIVSTCQSADLFHREIVKNRVYSAGSKKRKNKGASLEGKRSEGWVSTAMSCDLVHGDRHWRVSLASVDDQPAQIEVESEDESFIFEEISGLERVLASSSGEKTTEHFENGTPWEYSGASISLHSEQVGAISFTNPNAKFWIARDLPLEMREVLLGVGYGLILFTWLTDDWVGQKPVAIDPDTD